MQSTIPLKLLYHSAVLLVTVLIFTPYGFGYNTNELQVGEPIPPFAFDLLDNDRALSNESLEGKPYILYFWGTSCGICIREMPYLHDVAKTLKDRNIELISLSIDRDKETVREFRKSKFPMPWKHSVIGKDEEKTQALAQRWGLSGLPSKIFVSDDGSVLAHIEGFSGDELPDLIEQKF